MALFLNLEKDERRRKAYLNPRNQIISAATLDVNKELYKRYRFTQDGINFLCQLLNEELKMDPRGTPIPVEQQVLFYQNYFFLWYYIDSLNIGYFGLQCLPNESRG